MKTQDRTENPGVCPRAETTPGYLLDELSPAGKRAFEAHVAACPACARRVESFRGVIRRLRQLPPETRGRDLAPEILARLPRGAWSPARPSWWRRAPMPALTRIAAVLLAAAGLATLLLLATRPGATTPPEDGAGAPAVSPVQPGVNAPIGIPVAPSPLAMVESARGWLLKSQAIEGGWAAGRPDHGIGVSALALLAMMNGNPDVFHGPYATTVRKGIGCLIENQDEQGLIG